MFGKFATVSRGIIMISTKELLHTCILIQWYKLKDLLYKACIHICVWFLLLVCKAMECQKLGRRCSLIQSADTHQQRMTPAATSLHRTALQPNATRTINSSLSHTAFYDLKNHTNALSVVIYITTCKAKQSNCKNVATVLTRMKTVSKKLINKTMMILLQNHLVFPTKF